MKEVTKEFIRYASGAKHKEILDTLIHEIYVDTGNYNAFLKAVDFGSELTNNLLSGQSIYVKDTNKLTYKII